MYCTTALQTGGRVGVGTTSPAQVLPHVHKDKQVCGRGLVYIGLSLLVAIEHDREVPMYVRNKNGFQISRTASPINVMQLF